MESNPCKLLRDDRFDQKYELEDTVTWGKISRCYSLFKKGYIKHTVRSQLQRF